MTRREALWAAVGWPVMPQPPEPVQTDTDTLLRRIDTRLENLEERVGVNHSQVLEHLTDRQKDAGELKAELRTRVEEAENRIREDVRDVAEQVKTLARRR